MDEISILKHELEFIREHYAKLLDAHREIQRQNCLLEERILSIVENSTNDKEEIRHLNETIKQLNDDKQRYENERNLPEKLLHQNSSECLSTSSVQMSSQNLIIPTFPPTSAVVYTLVNTNDHQTSAAVNDNHSLDEFYLKHHDPSSHFICSKCHRTIQHSDVSVQTSPVIFDHPTSILIESHGYMTINEYHRRSSIKTCHDTGISSNAMPQMHTV